MFNLFSSKEDEYNYFTAFEEIASLITEATNLISDSLNNHPLNSLEDDLKEIQKINQIADEKIRELKDYLYKDFLPPIEREDILVITHALDEVLEETIDLMAQMDIYQIKTIYPEMIEFMVLVENGNQKLPELMNVLEEFKHPKILYPMIAEIYEIKTKGDVLYHRAAKNLYLKETDSLNLIKYSKIYDSFDEIMEALVRLMNHIEAVIIQNS